MSTRGFETMGVKLIVAVAAVLLLAAFQMAVQAKPAHAYQVKVSISGSGKVEETTPAHLLNCSTSATNPTGTVGATCFAGTPGGAYGSAWDVDYKATPASGYTFVQWQSDGGANPIICDRSTPAATSSTYSGSDTCKFRTFNNLQTRVVFVDLQSPSSPSITSTTPPFTNQAVSFSFSSSGFSDPTFRRFECRVTPTVQTSFQPCSSGVTFNPTTDGTYTFEVRAVDWSNNPSSSNSRSWTLDKTPPNVVLDPASGPAPGSTLESNSGEFRFSSADAQATFECRRYTGTNPPAFSACTSPATFAGLNDGRYTFEVRSVDRAGNRSPIASRQWTISNAPRVDSGTLFPAKGATGVLRNANIQATFTEAMYPDSLRDPFNSTSRTFKLQMYNKKTGKWKAVPATVTLSNADKTATLNPYGGATTLLGANKKFKATITTGAKDAAGNPMASNFIWTFKTGSAAS